MHGHVSRHEGVCHTHHLLCGSVRIELIFIQPPCPTEGMLMPNMHMLFCMRT